MSKQKKVTYFIDWSLGQKSVPDALEKAGADFKKHADCFAPDTPDVEWLTQVSQYGWIVLTKDQKIATRPLEIKAIALAKVKVFILVSGNLTSSQMADIFARSLSRIEKLVLGNKAPFIAKIYKNGRVELWKNKTQLLKIVR